MEYLNVTIVTGVLFVSGYIILYCLRRPVSLLSIDQNVTARGRGGALGSVTNVS